MNARDAGLLQIDSFNSLMNARDAGLLQIDSFNFRRHLHVHSDDTNTKPNAMVCTNCGKQILTSSGLPRHTKKIHTQITKYVSFGRNCYSSMRKVIFKDT